MELDIKEELEYYSLKELDWKSKKDRLNDYKDYKITHNQREILVSWLYAVTKEYHMGPHTYSLAVSYLDRIFSQYTFENKEIQAIGVVCLFIANKFEDRYPVTADDLSFITDDTFKRSQIIDYERTVINKLNFETNIIIPTRYIELFNSVTPLDSKLHKLASKLCDMMCIELATVRTPPSIVAVGSLLAASKLLDTPVDLSQVVDIMGIDANACCELMLENHYRYYKGTGIKSSVESFESEVQLLQYAPLHKPQQNVSYCSRQHQSNCSDLVDAMDIDTPSNKIVNF